MNKLKEYGKTVFVVGGKAFTSPVLQQNCHEFVVYEDILGITGRPRPQGARTRAVTDIAAAMPLIRRAIKLLADREVTPQLGLLKSTLLQLDSSFSERAYGASSFRDFVEKLAKAGHVILKGTDRSFHVELKEAGEPASTAPAPGAPPAATTPAAPPKDATDTREGARDPGPRERREPREPREPRGPREPREPRDHRSIGIPVLTTWATATRWPTRVRTMPTNRRRTTRRCLPRSKTTLRSRSCTKAWLASVR